MVVGAMLAVSASGARGQEAARASGTDEVGKLAAANDLDLKGNAPFHLAMTFQIFDMNGKAKETGSLEEWWAAPGSSRVVVHLAGLKEDGSAPAGAAPAVMRDDFLGREVIGAAERPVMEGQRAGETLKDETLKFGKTSLRCVTTVPGLASGPGVGAETMCTDPQAEDVRAVLGSDGNRVVLRNSVGKFHETYVALGLQISLLGQSAITGTVTALQNFDPATSEVKLPPPASESVTPGPEAGHVPAQVMAGRRVSFVEPQYPAMAKLEHLSGTVVMAGRIGADGHIAALTPIASTNPMFVEEALKAVRQWRYTPYLLNGKPTEVDTTITVNFALFRS